MKFNFRYGDPVAIVIGPSVDRSLLQSDTHERPRQTYSGIKWVTVPKLLGPEELNRAILEAPANLIILGDHLDLSCPEAVDSVVTTMASNRNWAGALIEVDGPTGTKEKISEIAPYDLPERYLTYWQELLKGGKTRELLPLCLYKTAIRQTGYFPSNLPQWYLAYGFFRYGRAYPLGLIQEGRHRSSRLLPQLNDEFLFVLDMLYNSENLPEIRRQILGVARRAFSQLGVREKFNVLRRQTAFAVKLAVR